MAFPRFSYQRGVAFCAITSICLRNERRSANFPKEKREIGSVLVPDDDPAVFAVQSFLDSLRPSRSHPARRVDSLEIPRQRGIEVETLDLLHACPIWHDKWLRHQSIARNPFGVAFSRFENDDPIGHCSSRHRAGKMRFARSIYTRSWNFSGTGNADRRFTGK